MSKLVSTVDGNSIALGNTFLCWSLHYLAGHTKTFNAQLNQFFDLPSDPVTGVNAHGFMKNHPKGLTSLSDELLLIQKTSSNTFETMYPLPVMIEQVYPDLTPHELAKIQKDFLDDLPEIFEYCTNHGPTIVVELNPTYVTYAKNVRQYDKKIFLPACPTTEDDIRDWFDEVFYADAVEYYKNNNLTEIWDKREFIALNERIYPVPAPRIDKTLPHYFLLSDDLYFNLDKKIFDIFDYIGETIDLSRFDRWLTVYKQWSHKQHKLIKFEWYRDYIVSSVVNGWDLDLSQFNLTLHQEGLIQHCLIYQYGLTIKGWGLTKFPKNSQDLHKLLEPNFHTLTTY